MNTSQQNFDHFIGYKIHFILIEIFIIQLLSTTLIPNDSLEVVSYSIILMLKPVLNLLSFALIVVKHITVQAAFNGGIY